MKIHTLSVIIGNTACNAQCPFCVSKMTPPCGNLKTQDLNFRNFKVACQFAQQSGVNTVLLTGKGEPTLFPKEINRYMEFLANLQIFPFIELQTNGLVFDHYQFKENYTPYWYNIGMTTISLSVVHYDIFKNAELIYPTINFDYWEIVDYFHQIGFSVRLNCTMVGGYMDNIEAFKRMVEKCNKYKVEQLTFRSATKPDKSENEEVANWIDHNNTNGFEKKLYTFLKENNSAVELLQLPHGATIFDFNGQNVCINNCLTSNTDPERIRQLIFFPDGHLRYDWKYQGAIIL